MQQTTNYKLNRVEREDFVKESIEALGKNAEKIDKLFLDFQGKLDRAENILPTQVASGENVYIDNAQSYPLIGLSGEGKCEQFTTTGRNKLFSDFSSYESGQYDLNGDKVKADYRIRTIDLIPVEPNTEYVIINPTMESGFSPIIREYNLNKEFLYSIGISRRFTTQSETKYIGVSIGETTSTTTYDMYKTLFENGTIKPFMCLSSEVDKSFEPYTGGQASPSPDYPQEIKTIEEAEYRGVGKNLFNKNNSANIINGYIGGSSSTKIEAASYSKIVYIPCEADTTYALQKMVSASKSRFFVFTTQEVPTTGVSIENVKNAGDNSTQYVYTTNGTAKYLCIIIGATNETTTPLEEILASIQIEKNTTVTAYEPYQESTLPIDLQGNELCKVGNTADKLLIDRKGNVAIEKNVSKTILNGSENWTATTGYEGFYRYTLNITDCVGTTGAMYGMNTHFTQRINQAHGAYEYLFVQKSPNGGTIFIQSKNLATVEELKAWLYENNVTVYYQVTTSEIINLGTIENPEIFKGVNNIVVETNAGNMNVEIEYVEDLQARLEKVEQAIISLGGI